MGQITGGSVKYSRTLQAAQFEPRKAEVDIDFAIADGEDFTATLNKAKQVAIDTANEMIGLKVSTPPMASSTSKEAAAAAMNAKDAKDETKTKVKVGRPPKVTVDPDALDDDAGHAAAIAKHTVVNGAAISTGGERVDPNAIDENFDEIETVVEITDKQLSDAAAKKNGVLKGKHEGAAPAMIKKLIASYFPTGEVASLSKMAKDKRADFLVKLEALA